jgi:hypothetical protein
MGPEQVRGEIADNQADQFSFGLVVVEAMCENFAFCYLIG